LNPAFLQLAGRAAQTKYEADAARFRNRICELPPAKTQTYLGRARGFYQLTRSNNEAKLRATLKPVIDLFR
jgi:hypothetical protein